MNCHRRDTRLIFTPVEDSPAIPKKEIPTEPPRRNGRFLWGKSALYRTTVEKSRYHSSTWKQNCFLWAHLCNGLASTVMLKRRDESLKLPRLTEHDWDRRPYQSRLPINQIDDLHTRLGSAKSLPEYVRALKALGVERYDSYLADGHSEYFGQGGQTVVSPQRTRCLPSPKPANAIRSLSTCAGMSSTRRRT